MSKTVTYLIKKKEEKNSQYWIGLYQKKLDASRIKLGKHLWLEKGNFFLYKSHFIPSKLIYILHISI